MQCTAVSQSAWRPEVDAFIQKFQGKAGIFFRDLESHEEFRYHDSLCFPAASLIKIPLFLAAGEKTGPWDWNMPVPVSMSNRAGGTGVIARLNQSYVPTWRELLFLSIAWSDNTAANQIIDCIGGFSAVQDWLRRKGAAHTCLERKMMDRQAAAAGKENMTSAADMGEILSRAVLHEADAIPQSVPAMLVEDMKHQQYRNKLPAMIPAESSSSAGRPSPGHVLVWNKTGDLGRIQHDAGIFTLPSGRRYILVICTEHGQDGQCGCRWIAEVSRCIWKSLAGRNADELY